MEIKQHMFLMVNGIVPEYDLKQYSSNSPRIFIGPIQDLYGTLRASGLGRRHTLAPDSSGVACACCADEAQNSKPFRTTGVPLPGLGI